VNHTSRKQTLQGLGRAITRVLAIAAVFSCFTAIPGAAAQTNKQDTPVLRPKVVVVVYFEIGKETGDKPGELQYWVERDHLDRVIDVPGMSRAVRSNADGSEVAVAVGPGNINPGVNLMDLGLSPRFDLRNSYWLINGIAGVSPREVSLASAVWTDYVIDGDLLHEIDAREMPRDWPDGFYALGMSRPGEQPLVPAGSAEDVRTWPKQGAHSNANGSVIRMNPALLAWAYGLTRGIKLPENEQMKALEAHYKGFPAAQLPPRVIVGANLAAETFWHGARMDAWAHRWVPYMTEGHARYGSTAMNDSGTMIALHALTRAGRADWNRAVILRTGSNFDMQAPDETAEQSANREVRGGYTAFEPSLESAYMVGSRVVRALIAGWPRFKGQIPSE